MSKELKTEKNAKAAGSKSLLGAAISINDLREREFNGESLSKKEKQALSNFDKFRIATLNNQEKEEAFHKKYRELQAMANLTPYEEFLKAEYAQWTVGEN